MSARTPAALPRISKLSQALELSSEARVITHGQAPFRIVHTNKAWHDITGYRFAEVVGQTSSFLQGPETERTAERALVKACRCGQHVKVRLINYSKTGEPFFNVLECFPLHDARGVLTHFCGVLIAEPAGASYARRVVQPLVQPSIREQLKYAADELDDDEPLPHGLGREAGVACSSSSGSNDGGGVSRRTSLEDDASRSNSLERQVLPPLVGGHADLPRRPLKRGREVGSGAIRLSDALNNDTDAVILTSPHPPYRITHVNAPWSVMCGYTQEEVEGQTNAILQGPETDQAILDDLMSSVRRGEASSAQLINYKKGGQKFVNQLQVMPVVNDDDELEHFMAMLNEVDDGISGGI